MRQLTLKLGIAVLTFSLGLVLDAATAFVSAPADELTIPVAQFQEEEWHKLYEAAGMTGDAATLRLVREKLMCTNTDGFSDARIVRITESVSGARVARLAGSIPGARAIPPFERTWCRSSDGALHEYNAARGPYGPFDGMIMDSHLSWSVKHLPFIHTLIPAERAKIYVHSHI